MAESSLANEKTRGSGRLALFLRLTRFQFIPLIILPGVLGTTLAYYTRHNFHLVFFILVISGIILLHLGANAIDDAYDYQNGVDGVANSMFPKDFGGWKPIPRGHVSLRDAKIVSFALFGGSLAIGIYFWVVIGPWAFALAFLGFLLAVIYCIPPFKLDYRGLGLGELSIFFSFGPIPVLGAYYVQTGLLGLQAFLISIPIGIMTVTILVDHDLIFYEVYTQSKKLSLATVLGRKNALKASFLMTLASYAIVVVLVFTQILPLLSLLAPFLSAIILLRKSRTFSRFTGPPSLYLPFTENALISNWIFALILALSLIP